MCGDLFWSENEFRNQFFVEFLFSCPLFFQMLCGHLIMLERLFATVCASRYEKCSGFVFSISWILILVLITIFNIYVKNEEESVNPEDIGLKGSAFGCTLFSLIASFFLALISLAEFLFFAYLWHYNKSEYSNQSGQTVLNANYQLTKQYQHLENIRTTRQLGPTLFIYFLIQLITAFEQAFEYFFYIADEYPQEIISQSNQLIMTLLGLIIELSIIIFHPILRQNFIDLLDRILPIKIVRPNRVAPALELAVAGSLEPRTSQQMDKHFVLLKNTPKELRLGLISLKLLEIGVFKCDQRPPRSRRIFAVLMAITEFDVPLLHREVRDNSRPFD
uniref:Gustatory receptor n=1 Tax=Globodera rostochiensis TaxID=31243 RepID=A0A914H8B4_GLORO